MGSRLKFRRRGSCIVTFISVLMLTTLVSHIFGCASQGKKGFGQIDYTNVHFSYIDKRAKSVCVAGDFNGWSKAAHCMTKTGESWSLDLKLAPGRYQYLFVIDGQVWRPDPGAFLNESNGFGGKNSVLIVD